MENQKPKLMDQVRNYLRLHHYAYSTERGYVDWIKRSFQYPISNTEAGTISPKGRR